MGFITPQSVFRFGKFAGGIFVSSNSYGAYNVYVDFTRSVGDRVSKEPIDATGLVATRYGYDGASFGSGEAVVEGDGLLTCGAYAAAGIQSEDISEWSGTGPWTKTISLTELTTYTLSTDTVGATVVVTAGTAVLT